MIAMQRFVAALVLAAGLSVTSLARADVAFIVVLSVPQERAAKFDELATRMATPCTTVALPSRAAVPSMFAATSKIAVSKAGALDALAWD